MSTKKTPSAKRRPKTAKRRLTMADVKRLSLATGSPYFSRESSKFWGGDKFYGPYVGPGGTFFVQHNKAGWKIKELTSKNDIRTVQYDGPVGYQGEGFRHAAQRKAKGE